METRTLDPEKTPKFFSITQYNTSVERFLKAQVPKVWVKGVITQLNVRGKIVYITLGEFLEGDARPQAVLEVTMWTTEYEMHNLRFSKLAIPLSLRVELKVAFQLEANFYVKSGRFQPRIVGVDENFTLGELSLTRQKTLERLMQEGLLNKNKKLPLSDLPLRVGLITAPGSAAYQDFVTVLLGSGFSFQISFVGAKMQGEGTEGTVLEALKILGKKPLDVICLVRGGGSKTDLVYFDSEKICRAIAESPIPVLTGIGHEIDHSLSDLVAFANKITPTDCAKFLENMLSVCLGKLVEYATQISETWRMELQQSGHEMNQRASVLKHHWEGRRATEILRGREQARTLAASTRQRLKAENLKLELNERGLSRGPRKILHLEKLRFVNRTQALGHGWKALRSKQQNRLREYFLRMWEKTERQIATEKNKALENRSRLQKSVLVEISQKKIVLKPWARLIQSSWRQNVRQASESMQFKLKLINSADPSRLLGLGFSILKSKDGKLIQSLADVPKDGVLVNQLKDGTVESKVLMLKEK